MQPFDWGLFLAFGLGIIAGLHFIIANGSVPASQIEHFMFRAQDTAETLAEGRLYPRWSPEALGGYGAPIPVFVPPIPGYLAGLFTYIWTGDPVSATRGVYALVLGAAASLMYLFMRRMLDSHSALLAAALYVFNPMIGLDIAFIQGDLQLLIGAALLPAWLWSLSRVDQTNKPLNIMQLSLVSAALILTDISLAVAAGAISLGYIAWRLAKKQLGNKLWIILAGILGGVTLSSFFWVPAIAESHFVRWLPPMNSNPLDTINWLAPIRAVDPLLANPIPQFAPGWTHLSLVIAGLFTAIIKQSQRPALLILATGIVIALLVSAFPLSPNLQKLLLVASAFFLAGIGGSILLWRNHLPAIWRRLPLPTLLIIVWVGSIPVWLPPDLSISEQTINDLAQVTYEVQGFGVAGLPRDQAVPVTISSDLPLNPGLLEGYQANTVNKLVTSQFTVDIQAALLDHNTHSDYFQLRASNPTTLSVLTACFPGWEAWSDASPISVTCNPTTGLIELNIPEAISGELVIQLGTTPLRTAAWMLSAVSLSILCVYSVRQGRNWNNPFEDISLLPVSDARLLALSIGAIGSLTFWLHQPNSPINLRPEPGFELRSAASAGFRSDVGLILLGYTQSESRAKPGTIVDVGLYWGTGRDLTSNYQIQLHLIETNTGTEWLLHPYHHPGDYPSRRWQSSITVLDRYRVTLPVQLEAGNYQFALQANDCTPDCESGRPVVFFNVDGNELGNKLRLPTRLIVE